MAEITVKGLRGGMRLKAHVFTCAQNVVFYFGVFTSLTYFVIVASWANPFL